MVMDSIAFVPLTRGLFAVVDAADFERLSTHSWTASDSPNAPGVFYAHRGASPEERRLYKTTNIKMHRFIMGFPPAMLDHRNGNTLDNRRGNLRLSTPSLNQANKKKQRGTFGKFKGVDFHKCEGKWRARITKDKRCFCIGHFLTEEAAARAYDAKARELFGEFARLNFPKAFA